MAIVASCAAGLSGGGGALRLTVTGPAQVEIGQRLVLTFTATNTGKDGLYFKKPWKWADNGMFVVATGADGSRSVSSTRVFDIDGAYLCTYFKPLFSKDQFSFEESLVIGPEPVWDPKVNPPEDKIGDMLRPHLDLKPGRYKLRWVYEPKLYPDESKCTAADLSVWSGRAESGDIELDVVK